MAHFDGATYDPSRDGERLEAQLARVRTLMLDGEWRTLEQIAAELDSPTTSVSARLRDLRKEKFGGYTVDRERVGEGLHKYRVRRPQPPLGTGEDAPLTLFGSDPTPGRPSYMDPDD